MKFINVCIITFFLSFSLIITGCLSGGAMKSAGELVEAKDYNGAIEAYQTIVDSKPYSADARAAQLAIGRIYINILNNPDEGIKVYETIIADAGGSEEAANAHYRLGMYSYNQKDYKEAQTRFESIIKDYPELVLVPDTQLMLAKSYEGGQEYVRAVEAFDNFAKRYPDNKRALQALTNKARIQREFLNDEDGTIQTYQSIVRGYGEDESAKAIVEKARTELIDLGQSPYGFGPYPEVPVDYPYQERLWDNASLEHELLVRVRVKLWEQGTKTKGAMFGSNGLVYPTIPGVFYVEWNDPDTERAISPGQRYARRLSGHSETIEKWKSIFLTENRYVRTDLQQKPEDFGITVYEYPDGGIDPYEFLGIDKKDKALDTLLE
ncbi:tetratricopeptide repeat protein [Candidatus Poribacteria bacterium]|nr:tetratricopeptide repeat protein [Candidatus Poribacteria bacterium]